MIYSTQKKKFFDLLVYYFPERVCILCDIILVAWSGPLHLVDLELFNIFYEIIKVSNAFVVHPKNAFVVHPKNCKLLIWKNYFLPKYVCKSSLCRSLNLHLRILISKSAIQIDTYQMEI